MYLRMHGQSEFKVPINELAGRSHPVTFLRIQLLSDLGIRMGYNAEADKLKEEWEKIAQTLGIVEDYFGYYEESFLPDLQQTIDDMLIQAEPQMFSDEEEGSPVSLLNQAWQKFDADFDAYPDWEIQAIEEFSQKRLSRVLINQDWSDSTFSYSYSPPRPKAFSNHEFFPQQPPTRLRNTSERRRVCSTTSPSRRGKQKLFTRQSPQEPSKHS